MTIDAWLPIGHSLSAGMTCGRGLFAGQDWQIVELANRGRALLVRTALAQRWITSGLLTEEQLSSVKFGRQSYRFLTSAAVFALAPVADAKSPQNKAEALAFALALKASRELDKTAPLEAAIYVEKISRLLPTQTEGPTSDDAQVLGRWLTGGVNIAAESVETLQRSMTWLPAPQIEEVIRAAGFPLRATAAAERKTAGAPFDLPGRSALAAFINEHIVDIVQNRERYAALGIGFPAAILLHGPPGCGKTFAVEQLIEFLGWPSFRVDASSVASPYIHETSKKVAAVFDQAMQNAPSVLVIDEMEAFLADREMSSGHYRVEEVAEFLRKIPEATKNEVLIVAMTNRIEMIDPAILRRGRFDHIIQVSYASETEVLGLLSSLLASLPTENGVDPVPLAKALTGRPLSDVSFVVRDAARRAARTGKNAVSQDDLLGALRDAPAVDPNSGKRNPIGFI